MSASRILRGVCGIVGVVGGGVGGIVGGARNRGRGDPALGTGKCKVQLRSPMRGLLRLRPLDTDIHPKHTHTDIQTKKSCSTDCCAPPFLTCSSRTRTPCAQGQSQSRGSSSRGQTAQHTGGGGAGTQESSKICSTKASQIAWVCCKLAPISGYARVKRGSNLNQTMVKPRSNIPACPRQTPGCPLQSLTPPW